MPGAAVRKLIQLKTARPNARSRWLSVVHEVQPAALRSLLAVALRLQPGPELGLAHRLHSATRAVCVYGSLFNRERPESCALASPFVLAPTAHSSLSLRAGAPNLVSHLYYRSRQAGSRSFLLSWALFKTWRLSLPNGCTGAQRPRPFDSLDVWRNGWLRHGRGTGDCGTAGPCTPATPSMPPAAPAFYARHPRSCGRVPVTVATVDRCRLQSCASARRATCHADLWAGGRVWRRGEEIGRASCRERV